MFSSVTPHFKNTLRAQDLSPKTISSYLDAVKVFERWLETLEDPPASPRAITKRHIEAWVTWMHDQHQSASVSNRFVSLRRLFDWLVEEEEIGSNPFDRLPKPKIHMKHRPVLEPHQLTDLIKICDKSSLWGCRDLAITRLFAGTGMRRGELLAIDTCDLNLETGVAKVTGKGRKERLVPFGPAEADALHRYLRRREDHRDADAPWLWISQRGGRFGESGINLMIKRRGIQAGIEDLHPHIFRHTFAHMWLAKGGQETDLMRIAGWADRQMLARYAASAGTERAHLAYERLALGGDF